jgi:hypothetical protein
VATDARLAYVNLLTASGVTISSSAQATGHPDDNLASVARWKDWRSSTTTGDQWAKFDLGSSKSFQVIAAIDVRVHTGGTLRFQANATDSWGAPTVNELITVPSPNFAGVLVKWLAASQSLRWIRFLFTNTGAVSEYVQIGAVFAGVYLQPTLSIARGVNVSPVDPSVVRTAIGGASSVVRRAQFHNIAGAFQWQESSERDNLRTAFKTVGRFTPCLFSVDPGDTGLTFYGRFEGMGVAHMAASVEQWDVPFQFVEEVA